MAKEKNFNPVQAAKKAEKQKQIKKQKATVQAQRNEKLARRNPVRIQRDIDNLKQLSESGDIRPHERQRLAELEKDLVAVNKAREALGDKAPQFRPERKDYEGSERGGRGGRGGGRGRGGVLGKRTRDGDWKGREGNESSDTDDDVKDIPMPRDTPPPIPRRHGRHGEAEEAAPEPKKPQLVYEAAPEVRDLRKEATRFMPTAVAEKMRLAKGEGRLLEADEFDKLQEQGYMNTAKPADDQADPELEAFLESQNRATTGEAAENAVEAAVQEAEYNMMEAEVRAEMKDSVSQARVAENKLRHVEIEEVEDEDL